MGHAPSWGFLHQKKRGSQTRELEAGEADLASVSGRIGKWQIGNQKKKVCIPPVRMSQRIKAKHPACIIRRYSLLFACATHQLHSMRMACACCIPPVRMSGSRGWPMNKGETPVIHLISGEIHDYMYASHTNIQCCCVPPEYPVPDPRGRHRPIPLYSWGHAYNILTGVCTPWRSRRGDV